MTDPDAGLALKSVELGDEFRTLVPQAWTCKPLSDGRWWCGDPEQDIGCFFRHEVAFSDGPPTRPLDNARQCLADMRQFLEQHGTVGDIVEWPTSSGAILHAVTDDTEESGPYRAARWYVAEGFSRGGSLYRVTLTVPLARWDDPMVPRLIEHFATRAEAGPGTMAAIGENLGMRDVRVDLGVIVSLPATWRVSRDEDQVYARGPEGFPRFVASVGYVDDEAVVEAMAGAGPISRKSLPEMGARAAGAFARTLAGSTVTRPVDRAPYGGILTTEVDDPAELFPDATGRVSAWYYVIPTGERCLVAGFVLEIPLAIGDRPDMIEAKAMVAREVGQLRLEFDED